ncbi:MAG: FHA domain-containing protein [Acidobacteria bacterium]|nr:FHA domain-containing protein [Acidobacteriota bacterium]
MASEEAPEKESSEIARINELTARVLTQARQQTAGMRTEPQLPADKVVSLLVTVGPMKGRTFRIEKPQVSIGRSKSEADIAVDDPKVSRIHCVVQVYGRSGLLVDLESANGTFVGGKKITSCELGHMSEFRVGGTTLMFAVTSST